MVHVEMVRRMEGEIRKLEEERNKLLEDKGKLKRAIDKIYAVSNEVREVWLGEKWKKIKKENEKFKSIFKKKMKKEWF